MGTSSGSTPLYPARRPARPPGRSVGHTSRNSYRLRLVVLGVLLLSLPAGVIAGFGATPVAAATAPHSFLSNYVENLSYSDWNNWGCAQAEYSAEQHVYSMDLILDFGNAVDRNGEYGTTLPLTNTFAQWDSGTTSGIRFLIANFLSGYWNCHDTATYGVAPYINLMVGIANSGTNGLSDSTNASWMAEVIAAVNNWISSLGREGVETANGAMDIEMEYGSYSTTVAYEKDVLAGSCNDSGQCSGLIPVYDFGEADCSQQGYSANSACGVYGWKQWQVLDVSYGETGAFPLPEIYNTTGAQATEWYWISKGGIQTGYGPLYFDAELTQYTACTQLADAHYGGNVGEACPGTDNMPAAGWNQLYNAIYDDSSTRPGVTGGWLTHSADIRYLPDIY